MVAQKPQPLFLRKEPSLEEASSKEGSEAFFCSNSSAASGWHTRSRPKIPIDGHSAVWYTGGKESASVSTPPGTLLPPPERRRRAQDRRLMKHGPTTLHSDEREATGYDDKQ